MSIRWTPLHRASWNHGVERIPLKIEGLLVATSGPDQMMGSTIRMFKKTKTWLLVSEPFNSVILMGVMQSCFGGKTNYAEDQGRTSILQDTISCYIVPGSLLYKTKRVRFFGTSINDRAEHLGDDKIGWYWLRINVITFYLPFSYSLAIRDYNVRGS